VSKIKPELLANGDVLVPVRDEAGQVLMERVEVGEQHHAGWVKVIQSNRRSDRGGTALAVFIGGVLAFFAVWGLAQASPDNIAVPVKFFVSQDKLDSITGSGPCTGSSDISSLDYDPDC
jgi:hypothetical protein